MAGRPIQKFMFTEYQHFSVALTELHKYAVKGFNQPK